jgi:hypothetical protein
MTPLPPGALDQLLQNLPPERPDPFPHLANLTPDQLLQRRAEITGNLKTLEQERQAIDAELLDAFSPAELRQGIRAPGGFVLRQRTRTSWIYPPVVKEAIQRIQKTAQESGDATELRSTYIVLMQESP